MTGASAPPQASDCLNCGAALGLPRPRFCGQCGQETNLRAPRLTEFVQQLGGAYFSTEGALWRTLGLLLFRPGELTRRYLAGRRKHYVLPLRLYLTISLMSLLLLRLQVPSDFQFAQEAARQPPRPHSFTVIDLGNGSRAGMQDGKFFCEALPTWLCARLQARFDVDAKSFAREMERLPERFISQSGTAMFLLVPFFALLHKVLYLPRRLRYTEHLVYALHVHSFWFAALGVAQLPFGAAKAAMAFAVPLYTLLAARRVYGGGWISTLARALAVSLAYAIVLGVALALVGIWAFLA